MAGQLTLSNITAQFIKDKELIGKQDPYLIFDCGGQQTTTNAIKSGGTDCVWTESYTVPKAGSVLKVTAYNKNTLRPDSLLGVGEMQLNKCTQGSSTRIPLMDKSGNETGDVRLHVSGGGIGSGQQTTGVGAGQTTTGAAGTGQGVHHGVGGAAAGTGVAGAVAGAAATHHHHQQTAVGTGVGSGTTVGTGTDEYATRGTGVHQGVHSGVTTGTHGVTTGTHGVTTGTHTTGTHTNEAARDAVCGREFFTKVDDRTVDKEEVIRIREHHPVEKQFVVETRPTGTEREQVGEQKMETLDRTTRVVGATKGDPCSGVPTGQTHREV